MISENFFRSKTALVTLFAACFVVLISLGVRQVFGLFFIDFNESLKLVERLIKISNLYYLSKLDFFIKPHPVNNLKFKKYINKINLNNFKIIESPFKEIINNVDLVLGNGTSSLVESLLYKKPVIVVSDGKNLLQNPIPKSVDKRIYSICYSEKEIHKKIKYFLSLSDSDIQKFTNSIETDFFIRPTKKNVNELLETM